MARKTWTRKNRVLSILELVKEKLDTVIVMKTGICLSGKVAKRQHWGEMFSYNLQLIRLVNLLGRIDNIYYEMEVELDK